MYNIRGRHSTVYPVQLPSWSSPDVVKELIERYDAHLREQLFIMLENHDRQAKGSPDSPPPKSGHVHTPSLQSVSSAITNISHESADSNVREDEVDPDTVVPGLHEE